MKKTERKEDKRLFFETWGGEFGYGEQLFEVKGEQVDGFLSMGVPVLERKKGGKCDFSSPLFLFWSKSKLQRQGFNSSLIRERERRERGSLSWFLLTNK